jgi:hypothetical protein
MIQLSVIIYSDNTYKVDIEFYVKPAVITLSSNNDALLTIDINKKYISGEMIYYDKFISWLNKVNTELEVIIWEWENRNDNFELIKEKLVV